MLDWYPYHLRSMVSNHCPRRQTSNHRKRGSDIWLTHHLGSLDWHDALFEYWYKRCDKIRREKASWSHSRTIIGRINQCRQQDVLWKNSRKEWISKSWNSQCNGYRSDCRIPGGRDTQKLFVFRHACGLVDVYKKEEGSYYKHCKCKDGERDQLHRWSNTRNAIKKTTRRESRCHLGAP